MKVLVDTNVVLDQFLARAPYAADANRILAAVETGKIQGYLCANSVTTVFYITKKAIGSLQATSAITKLVSIFQIAPVTSTVIQSALRMNFPDFEDAVIHESGAAIPVQGIVTRNIADYRLATIPVYEPPQLIALQGL